MSSLRLRLVLLLSVTLGLAWAAAAWFTHREARHEIDALFDAQLAQSAQVLLGTSRHELRERVEHGDDVVQMTHQYELRLAFQIWDEDGLLTRSTNAPLTPFSATQEAGYDETRVNGEPWRVLTRWDIHHEFKVQVGEPLAERERLARHIALKMLLPTVVILPVLALLIWIAVGAGIRPLYRLRQEVGQRTAEHLEPVRMQGVPDEVVPLVHSLNDLFARLKQAFEGERRFTADAAHELRTPLAALKTQAQVALRATDEVERRTALENVLRGVDRAGHLLQQLLTLARVDPEAAAAGFAPVDLHAMAATALAEIAPLAHARHVELSLETGPAGRISGNAAQLSILLRNLLDNAIRYTPEHGSVSVSVIENGGVILRVQDSGPGIPAEERERVKQRFYRIPGSETEGSGLGLSIVHRIAELHGAQVALSEATSAGGLAVTVSFPAA